MEWSRRDSGPRATLDVAPDNHLRAWVTTTTVVELDRVLPENPTLPGDPFPHAVRWCGELFLENGLHWALRAALQQRTALHVRILDLDLLRR